MADRRAVNKYYPPEWDPSKGSINTYNKSHPLRSRARKIGDGILVVRFEMPFNVWCIECKNHIGMGVRYNAEKSKVGSYYTTPIYQFSMKCHLCDNHFEIQTDPKKLDYVITKGATRQVRMVDNDEDRDQANVLNLESAEEANRRLTDSMFRLEKKVEDQIKGEAEIPNLLEIKIWRDKKVDEFSLNQLARSQFRKRRKACDQARKHDKNLLQKASLSIALSTPKTDDRNQAKRIMSKVKEERITISESLERAKLQSATKFMVTGSKSESL